ncbi:putative histone-fold, protein Dr1 [Helianthus debilis subsp. tardiflorus]
MESNEVCSKEDRRTIAPEHVLKELQDPVRGGKCANVREMTEEEAAAEQQRMFAEARARMNGVAPTLSVTKVEAVLRMLWRWRYCWATWDNSLLLSLRLFSESRAWNVIFLPAGVLCGADGAVRGFVGLFSWRYVLFWVAV